MSGLNVERSWAEITYNELLIFYAVYRLRKENPDLKPRVNEIIDLLKTEFPGETLTKNIRKRQPNKAKDGKSKENKGAVKEKVTYILQPSFNVMKKSLIAKGLVDNDLKILIKDFNGLELYIVDEEANDSVVKNIFNELGVNELDVNDNYVYISYDALIVFYVLCLLECGEERPERNDIDRKIQEVSGRKIKQKALLDALQNLYDAGLIDYNLNPLTRADKEVPTSNVVVLFEKWEYDIIKNIYKELRFEKSILQKLKLNMFGKENKKIVFDPSWMTDNVSKSKEENTTSVLSYDDDLANDFPVPSKKEAYHERKLVKKLLEESYLENVLGKTLEGCPSFLADGHSHIWQCFYHYKKSGKKSSEGDFYITMVRHIAQTIYQNTEIFGELLGAKEPEQISKKLQLQFKDYDFEKCDLPEDVLDEVANSFNFYNSLKAWYEGKDYNEAEYIQLGERGRTGTKELIELFKRLDRCEETVDESSQKAIIRFINVDDNVDSDKAPFTLKIYQGTKEDDCDYEIKNKRNIKNRMALFLMLYKLYRFAKNN